MKSSSAEQLTASAPDLADLAAAPPANDVIEGAANDNTDARPRRQGRYIERFRVGPDGFLLTVRAAVAW